MNQTNEHLSDALKFAKQRFKAKMQLQKKLKMHTARRNFGVSREDRDSSLPVLRNIQSSSEELYQAYETGQKQRLYREDSQKASSSLTTSQGRPNRRKVETIKLKK